MYAISDNNFSPQPTAQGGEPSIFPPQTRRPQQAAQHQHPQQHPEHTQRKPGHKSPKLRTSCDSCASAKVRCSKEHPKCERCIECNFSCVYGLSMKHGKGSQRRRLSALQTASGGSRSVTLPSEQNRHNYLQQFFSEVGSIGGTASISSIQPWPSSNDVAMRHKTPHITASSTFDDPFWNNAMAHGNAGTNSNETMRPTSHGPASAYLDDALSLLSNTGFSPSISSDPSNLMSSPSSSASPVIPNRNTPLLQPQMSSGSGRHDCYMIANSTLAMLHVSSRPMSSDNDSDAESVLSSNPPACVPMRTAQHLDEVLCCTKEAMDIVHQLLGCPCASDSQMALLYASIMIRILFWHRLAARVKTSTSLPLPSWDGSPVMDPFATTRRTANSSQKSSCSTPTAFVTSKPIKIGNYVPDQDDQEPLRQMLLLISLKKLGRLVERFAHVGDPVKAGPSQIRGILASWLNSELHQNIKAVGKRAEGAKAAVGQQFDILPHEKSSAAQR